MISFFRNNAPLLTVLFVTLTIALPLVLKISLPQNCCAKSSVSDNLDHNVVAKIGAILSENEARQIAQKYRGERAIQIAYSFGESKQIYRVRTVTQNSEQLYDTWIDARSGKVLFRDEIWWLVELF